MPIKALLFDFDGTLADSFEAITASTNHFRRSYGLPPLPESTVRQYVGFGMTNLLEHLVPGADTAEAAARYREHHPKVMLTGTHLRTGVAETIPALHQRGYRMAVCSNKLAQYTRELVAAFKLEPYFVAVLGPEDVGGRAKPDPAMLLEGLGRLEVSTAEAVYVGDMAIDVHSARAAGVPVWIFPGGAAGHESVTESGPDRVLKGFTELLELLPVHVD
jgi:phosphoglycolate phosphatase